MKYLQVAAGVLSCFLFFCSCSSTNISKSAKNESGTKLTGTEAGILKKYAKQLNVPVSRLQIPKLYEIIDQWLGVPYRYGGTTKKGVDCSAFAGIVYKNVAGKILPRSAGDIYKIISPADKLQEGDLLFFNYDGKNSHVGIYLHNGKFVHASVSLGVTISDLNSDHYRKTFNRGGPLKAGRLSRLSTKR